MEIRSGFDPLPDALSMRYLEAVRAPMPHGLIHVKTAPFAIMVEATAGTYRVTHGGRTVEGTAGRIIVVPPNTQVAFEHSRGDDPEMEVRFAHLSFLLWNALDPLDLVDLPLTLDGEPAREAAKLMERMMAIPSDLDVIEASATRLAIGSGLLRILLASAARRDGAADRLEQASRLAPVIRVMRERLGERLDIDALCALAHCSRATLHRRFLDAVGIPPLRFLKMLRLDEAARLLATSDDSIAAISTRIGFATPYHFSREFTARFGRSPTAYRRDPIALLSSRVRYEDDTAR